jgi:hypothetical protein
MVNAVVAPKISPYAVFNGSAVPLELLSIVLYFEVGVIHGILMELTEGGAEHERILTTWTSNEVRNH